MPSSATDATPLNSSTKTASIPLTTPYATISLQA
jgi:hypothetical protein